MIKCKDCKAFSPQSECGGVCNFTNFGTVKNDDGCHAGAIINDIYNLGRADVIDEVKHQMISLHTDMIFRYGADIVEARCDAFDELKEWLKEKNNGKSNEM